MAMSSCVRVRHASAGEALRDTLPLLIGLIPFGLAYGVSSTGAGLSLFETWLMSAIVFAGSSQFAAVQLLAAGAAPGLIVMSALLINLRHLLMGASLAPYLNGLHPRGRAGLAFFLTDEAYSLTMARFLRSGPDYRYQAWASLSIYFGWMATSVSGWILGRSLPDPMSWGLDFAMPLTFLGILASQVTDRASAAAAVTGGLAAVVGFFWLPGQLYLVAAAAVGVACGLAIPTERPCVEPDGREVTS